MKVKTLLYSLKNLPSAAEIGEYEIKWMYSDYLYEILIWEYAQFEDDFEDALSFLSLK